MRGPTLIVVDHVAQVVAAAVVGFAHAHRVVREVDIAVVAKDWEFPWLATRAGKGWEGALTFWHLDCDAGATNGDAPSCGCGCGCSCGCGGCGGCGG